MSYQVFDFVYPTWSFVVTHTILVIYLIFQAVGMWKAGLSEREISTKLNISKTAIHNAIVRYKNTNTVAHAKRTGRPKKLTKFADRKIVSLCKKKPFLTATDVHSELQNCNVLNCTVQTARNRLRDGDLRSYRAAKKFYLNNDLARKHITFCKRVRTWTTDHWRKVLWSDEFLQSLWLQISGIQ